MPLPKEEAHTLSSLIQAISSSSSITKMALFIHALHSQFNTCSRHKPASLWLQLMKQINRHTLTIPANSGANLTLSTTLWMTLTLFPLILLPDLSILSQQKVDLTVLTMLGPYYTLKMLSTIQPTKWHTIFFIFLATTQSTTRIPIHSSHGNQQSITEQWLSTHCSRSSTQHRLHRTLPWISIFDTQKNLDHLLFTFGYLIVVPHATLHPSSPTFETLKPATYPFHLQMEPQSSWILQHRHLLVQYLMFLSLLLPLLHVNSPFLNFSVNSPLSKTCYCSSAIWLCHSRELFLLLRKPKECSLNPE